MNSSKISAVDDSINHGASTSATHSHENSDWGDLCNESLFKLLDEPFDTDLDRSGLRSDEKYSGFDDNSGTSWIYPKNYPMRHYQFNITKSALFRNTLVVLPTGLGKTFIAAVVMYNIYRWYPTGKVIFMAPTKPLVSQQIEACRKIMGIPKKDTAEITGKQNKKARQDLWQSKRVFFVTPHVVQNDINDSEQNFPFDDVRLVVVDEAHKAKGRYAHSEAVKAIASRNSNFRVLALSATPGRRIEDVIEVIQNLFISHLEIRWENSLDVSPYTHKKSIKMVVVSLGEDLVQIRNDFVDIIDPYIRYLIENQVISGSISSISRGSIVMEQKRFRELSSVQKHPNESHVKQNFSICISLYYALELLERHGLRVFLNYFNDPSKASAQRYFVSTDSKLKQFLDKLRNYVGPDPFLVNDQTMINGKVPEIPQDLDFGHPKFLMVKKSLVAHFEEMKDSRVIVFCEFRESVLLMYRALLQSRPLVKPRVFVGQGGTGSIRAVTQKQQLEVMDQFRAGVCNTLIATSVAEEGIDVGEVDLIICFDISTKDPTRFIQRIGRTGRRRQGKIMMMVTEGKEHAVLKDVLQSKDKLNQKVVNSREVARMLNKTSPRIVPPEFNPKCIEMFMVVNDEKEAKPSNRKSIKETKTKVVAAKKSKTIADSQKNSDVRSFFKKIELDKEEQEIFCSPGLETSSKLLFELKEPVIDQNNLNKLLKKINKFAADSTKSKNTDCQTSSIAAILKNSTVNSDIKRFILKLNWNYVKEKYEAVSALNAVNTVDDIHMMGEDELNIKIEFGLIEKLLGKAMIDEILSENHIQNASTVINNKFAETFRGLKKRGFDDCVEPFLDELIAKIPAKIKDAITQDIKIEIHDKPRFIEDVIESESDVCDSEDGDQFDYDEIDEIELNNGSRYMSQWTQFNNNKIVDQSSPLRSDTKIELNVISMSPKELFPVDEFINNDDPFGVIEAESKRKEYRKTQTIHNEIESKTEESNLFDDDFDEFLPNTQFITQIERAEKNMICSPEIDGDTIEDILKIVAQKEKEMQCMNYNMKTDENRELSSKASNTSRNTLNECENRLPNNDIEIKLRTELENLDVIELFDPFDCHNAFAEDVVKSDLKNCNKSINMFESINGNSNSPKFTTNISKQISNDLFSSDDHSLKVLKKTDSPSENVKLIPNQTSPSVLKKRPNLGRLRLTCSNTVRNDISPFRQYSTTATSETRSDAIEVFNATNADAALNHNITGIVSGTDSPCTAFAVEKRRKRLILSSDSEDEEMSKNEENVARNANKQPKKKRKVRRKRCHFLDDEAIASGDEDENKEAFEYSQYQFDSIVIDDDDVEDHPDLDMQAKYLQSVRSPIKAAFKIPAQRIYNDMSHIFSQPVPYESDSVYKEDSFVVISDEEEEYESTQECVLERAEAILKARRRAKRRKRLDDDLTLDGYEFGPQEEDDEEAYHELKLRHRNTHKIYKIQDSSEDEDE